MLYKSSSCLAYQQKWEFQGVVVYYREGGGLGILDPGFQKKLQPPFRGAQKIITPPPLTGLQVLGSVNSDLLKSSRGCQGIISNRYEKWGALPQRNFLKLPCKDASMLAKKITTSPSFGGKQITTPPPTLISRPPLLVIIDHSLMHVQRDPLASLFSSNTWPPDVETAGLTDHRMTTVLPGTGITIP